jgi:hypothetical protein
VSVSFGFQPNVQRQYQIGSYQPYDSFVQKTRTLQINVYGQRPDGAGGSSSLDVTPSTTCEDASTVNVTVNPASCVGSLIPFTEDYFISGYGYQKEALGYGQESWSFTSKPVIDDYTGTIVMLRGIAEGSISTGDGAVPSASMGVVVDETASNDSTGSEIEGESGSVQAGSPGVGDYTIQRFVVVTSVGASVGKSTSIDGLTGQANISITNTPVYL